MAKKSWYHLSLANKCFLLFALAVLSIMGATLFMPWVQMAGLHDEAGFRKAQQVATIARLAVSLEGSDWGQAQAQLRESWPVYAKLFGLERDIPVPHLVPVETADIRKEIAQKTGHSGGFIVRKTEQLRADPIARYAYRFQTIDEVPHVRLAMAVRSPDTESQPGALRGIIDVRVPWPRSNTWNLITVTCAGLSGMLLALLVFYLIMQKLFLAPVRSLRRVAEQVTTGDLEVRSSITTGDEFEELGDAFNDMLTHLGAQQEELTKINRSLDIKLGELAEANVALFESNKLKTEFVGNVSHELRTPLVSIIGFAELLADAVENPPEDKSRMRRYARNILTSGRMLLDLINDLLDLAKIEAGKLKLHLAEFDIGDTCESVIEFYRPLADKKNLDLGLTVEDGIDKLNSDAGKIKQILYNLVSNAIKFTPTGGTVRVGVTPADGEHVRLSVSDTGPGIAADEQEIIFEKFRQLDASVTREHGGAGLGLAITRELAQMLGGRIDLESEEGKGCTFVVTLPWAAPEQQVSRPLTS
ncbi:MAG: HAMP domain-containing histidine kinase [Phycisphaerae bacterium]|nr:HAMP domain-containing histidine kinase [Phycisphaerae bacterium]